MPHRPLLSPSVAAALAACFWALAPAPAWAAAKVGVLPVQAGNGVDKKVAAALTEAVAGAVAKTGVEVITEAQLKALLDLDAQKRLAGCSDDACMAQIGEALGADALVTSTLSKVGRSWLVGLRSVDTKTGASRLADRRLKNGSLDDVLDVLPALVAELMGPVVAPAATPVGATTPTTSAALAPEQAVAALHRKAPPSTRDVALKVDDKRLLVVTDGKGLVIAYDPKPESGFAPFFAAQGDPTKLYAQRVSGGGRNGDESFDVVFWEPRVKERWQAAFGMKDGKLFLQCGDDKIDLKPTKLVRGASFYDVRWQRKLYAAARTDDGVYFLVDVARVPDDSKDFRLYTGKKGSFAYAAVDDAIVERDELVFMTKAGRLRIASDGASWTPAGAASIKLKALDIEDIAGDAYGRLGVYNEPLGTPCDAHLAR